MVKHTQTIRRQKPTNCLSVFDRFVGLAFKGLKQNIFHERLTLLEFTLALVVLFRSFPSKQDVDVLRAMGNVTCDPMEYPYLTRWKRYMESFPSMTINR